MFATAKGFFGRCASSSPAIPDRLDLGFVSLDSNFLDPFRGITAEGVFTFYIRVNCLYLI